MVGITFPEERREGKFEGVHRGRGGTGSLERVKTAVLHKRDCRKAFLANKSIPTFAEGPGSEEPLQGGKRNSKGGGVKRKFPITKSPPSRARK